MYIKNAYTKEINSILAILSGHALLHIHHVYKQCTQYTTLVDIQMYMYTYWVVGELAVGRGSCTALYMQSLESHTVSAATAPLRTGPLHSAP